MVVGVGDVAPAGSAIRVPVTTICWTEDDHVRPEDMAEWAAYGPVRHVVLAGDDYTHRSAPAELLTVITDDFPE